MIQEADLLCREEHGPGLQHSNYNIIHVKDTQNLAFKISRKTSN